MHPGVALISFNCRGKTIVTVRTQPLLSHSDRFLFNAYYLPDVLQQGHREKPHFRVAFFLWHSHSKRMWSSYLSWSNLDSSLSLYSFHSFLTTYWPPTARDKCQVRERAKWKYWRQEYSCFCGHIWNAFSEPFDQNAVSTISGERNHFLATSSLFSRCLLSRYFLLVLGGACGCNGKRRRPNSGTDFVCYSVWKSSVIFSSLKADKLVKEMP